MVLWIEELFILPEYQGHGYGKELMTYIEEKYKQQVARIRLEVEDSNQRAVQLYRKMGFADLDYSQMYKSTENSCSAD
jgi:ribosomal protein S18 acetylase RimI-like enzyme